MVGNEISPTYQLSLFLSGHSKGHRYKEITHGHDTPPFSVAQGIFWLSSERLSCSTIHLIEGRKGRLYSCTQKTCNHVVLHRPLCEDSVKIPERWTSTYVLHLSDKGLIDWRSDDDHQNKMKRWPGLGEYGEVSHMWDAGQRLTPKSIRGNARQICEVSARRGNSLPHIFTRACIQNN